MTHLLGFLETLRTPAAFLFVLGVLIFVHELGHFLMARLHGVRVVTFSLGFGPKLLKLQRGDTEYCVSAVPLGGYVKLAGESVEDDRTGAPDEFMSKSKWVRFQVYLAGPIMNLLLAVVVLAIVLLRGADVPLYETAPPVVGTVAADSAAAKAGIRAGDRIVAVSGRAVATWTDLDLAVMPKANREIPLTLERDGRTMDVRITPDAFGKFEIGNLGIAPVMRPEFTTVNRGGAADHAGIQRGDVVVAVNGDRTMTQPQIIDRIRKGPGTPITFTLERDGQTRDVTVTPEKVGGQGQLGVLLQFYEVRRVDPNFVQAFQMSAQQNWEQTVIIGRTLRGLLTFDTPVKQLMGPVAIGQLAGSAAQLGWIELLRLMAMISLNLGLLNLMPVPVLDGGHIAILAFEGLARRDLSVKVKERILIAGAALIGLLMITVIYNDVARMLK